MTSQPSMVMTRIGGQDYPVRSVAQCKTCQSPHRMFIEQELIKARSYATIAAALQGLPPGSKGHPTAENIANHVKQQHLPLAHATQRRIVERRALELGKSIEHDDSTLADHVTVAQMVVQRGVEMVSAGTLDIKGSDVLAAARFLHQVEQSAGMETDTQVWIETIMEYMVVAQRHMDPQTWEAFAKDLNRSPTLKALASKLSGGAVQSEVLD